MAASSRQYSFVLCDRQRCCTVNFFLLSSFFSRIVGILIFSDLTFLPLLGTSWIPAFFSWTTLKTVHVIAARVSREKFRELEIAFKECDVSSGSGLSCLNTDFDLVV